MGPLQRALTVEEGARLLVYAAQNGVTMADTAQSYATYPYIRAALKSVDIAVSTKSYAYDRETARAALEEAQTATGKDVIDLMLLHEQESLFTLRGHREALDYYTEQKIKGRIKAVGISTHYVAAVEAASRLNEIDVIHPIFNMAGIGVVDGGASDMERAVKHAHDLGIGIMGMKALGGGHLIQRRREAFEYVFSREDIDCVAVGVQSFEEIDYVLALADGREPDEGLAKRERTLLVQDWCEACGNCARVCPQGALCLRDGMARVDQEKCLFCGYCVKVCKQFCIKVI
jgi:aryl-alcohol dehydrogenase-like predicted oxidoreductase